MFNSVARAGSPEHPEHARFYISRTKVVRFGRVQNNARFSGKGSWYGNLSFRLGHETLLTIALADGSIETVENPKICKKILVTLQNLQRSISKEELAMKALIPIVLSAGPVKDKIRNGSAFLRNNNAPGALNHEKRMRDS